jgi:flagella basal body P-ring formation protein FlgA
MSVRARECRGTLLPALLAAAFCLGTQAADAADEARSVFVPGRVIYPGDVITADALVNGRFIRDSASPAVFGENPNDLVGKVARRTLMRGELVPNSAVREQDVVVQGRPYKLTYSSEFVSIVGTGIPLQSGSAGALVSVRNPDTGLIIKARVQPDQTLAVEEQ